MDLNGKVALVTGGSRGIGKAIALKLASLGAKVVINYSSSDVKAKEVVEEIKGLGSDALAVKANVAKMDETKNLIEKAIEKFEKVDILVNNAGITRDNLLMRMSEEEWDSVFNVNMKGTFNVTKSLIRSMIKQKNCSIINIASVVGITGNAGQSNYSASKAGIIGFTKSIAKEVAKKNVRVNAIAPGFIETAMTDELSDKVKDEYMKNIPLKRLGKPEDIANTVAFLASDMSSYITGQVIVVDGGMIV
ncbi:3-oxoacyl-[acyl-carrier-protein] reductase [Sporosalibacterium faouarense]|uniref:3-oxoacyl-[acyl-carrier-protein] reductase n=1 Tax=Sporosalibacterium faouarense TaxID=516123 RepID=UPI00141D35E8|nr:3-oxoacyl-[acyl-carrier-protein] reductase [Sporosalibacterium faouarense]MTI47696.1 3-oxoacyl-[acyl-carrier-protein] reductase [Bacillota bacterium]